MPPEFIRSVDEIRKSYAQYRGLPNSGVIADVLFLLDALDDETKSAEYWHGVCAKLRTELGMVDE